MNINKLNRNLHSKVKNSIVAILLLVVFTNFSETKSEAAVPSGFSESLFVAGLDSPTSMAFAPDGRLFVTEQKGHLRIIQNGVLQPGPAVSLGVDAIGERGLLGIAFDPNFTANQYIYLYYTVPGSPPHNRLSRFTMAGNQVMGGSELAILDLEDLGAELHNGGALHFGPDNMLYVAVGENSVPNNAQSLSNQLGKILRINPAAYPNIVPPDNPFVGVPDAVGTIWALGLRNPFTFAFQPGTGLMFINDVGQVTIEEINRGASGANYGWPLSEGPTSEHTAPIYYYPRSNGCAITGGVFYNPPTVQFPDFYHGDYFFADLCEQWIRHYDVATGEVATFAENTQGAYIVDLDVSYDGSLHYLAYSSGAVYQITFGLSEPPTITQHPESLVVSKGESASFNCSASGAAVTYRWERNGVVIPGAARASYTLPRTTIEDNGAIFRCIASNRLGSSISNEALLTVIENTLPVAQILAPTDSTFYNAGATIEFYGAATDAEDGALPESAFTWWIDFHHDRHTHPGLPPTSGIAGGSFPVPTIGETSANVWYRVYLRVVDATGLTHTIYQDVMPNKVNITILSEPAGMRIKVDGTNFTTPATFASVVGIQHEIIATSPQRVRGVDYHFWAWSVESGAALTFIAPPEDTTFTVVYTTQQTTPPVVVGETELIPSDCSAQILNSTLRRRTGPGTNYEAVGLFALNEQLGVIGINVDSSNQTWIKLQEGNGEIYWTLNNQGWISLTGACDNLPITD